MQKIVIATDSFKECMDGYQVAKNIQKGFKSVFKDSDYFISAIADGGEGTTQTLINALDGSSKTVSSFDPLGRKISSFIGFNADKSTAFIEMASSSGLELLTHAERNPLLTTTFGTGTLIKEAINHGVEKIIIGLGGSATNDLGTGMLQALGVRFYDQYQQEIQPCGGNLLQITHFDLENLIDLSKVSIIVACDVTNPLLGPKGASNIFAKQKGASEQDIALLEKNLSHLAQLFNDYFQTNCQNIIGGGAAGGMGVALKLFLNGSLQSGSDIILDQLAIEDQIQNADLVITGEGRLDHQSTAGKGPLKVAELAGKYQIPCIAICGSLGANISELYNNNLTAAFSIMRQPENLDSAILHTAENLTETAHSIAQILQISDKYKKNEH